MRNSQMSFTIIGDNCERSQNTVLLASTQATMKGTVQYSTGAESDHSGQSSQQDQLVKSCTPATSRVTCRFGSDKLYICLSNKCFKVYPVYSLCIDVRPSQDHRILCMQKVWISLA